MDKKKEQGWIQRWGTQVRPTRVPNVFQMKKGGHYVRCRVVDPTTGKKKEIKKSLPQADEASAFKWLADEKHRIKAGLVLAQPQQTRFAQFAASLFERKVIKKQIKSARGRERWRYATQYLIEGRKTLPAFGEMFIDQIGHAQTEHWNLEAAKLITAGVYSPVTINGFVSIAKSIGESAVKELGLAANPFRGLDHHDTSEHPTYTEEEPNALNAEETKAFLDEMRASYPQHYAMTLLGFATGLRPSSLRPLRRQGTTPEIRWTEGVVLVRRSHTLGTEVMETTKTGLRQRITVPPELVDVLRWHVETQLGTPEQKESDLLFPREDGGIRVESCLKKAFDVVGGLIGLKKNFTPRGMRRTFNDMMRAAKVEGIVTKSISGHLTDGMKDHYSTVSPIEQRDSIGRVLRLVHSAPAEDNGSPATPAEVDGTDAGGAKGGASAPGGGAKSKTG